MNESVALVGGPELMRNSLIRTDGTFRTFSAAVSDSVLPLLVHRAVATRSPLNAAGPEVTLNIALTIAPGATGSVKVFAVSVPPVTTEAHCFGPLMLRRRFSAGAPVVFVK